MPFDTPLSPQDEVAFRQWKAKVAPHDSGQDYDFRGAFKRGFQPSADGHWPDTFKKPSHPTFSDESVYSSLTGTRPGTWQGDTYKPFGSTTMPQAPQQYQPQMGYQPNPQLQALQGVIQAIRGQAGAGSQQPWGFHEPTINAGAGVEQGLSATGQAMADPRNAWMGLGGIAGMARFRRVPDFGTDAGGYQASINHIRQALGVPKPNRYLNEIPGGTEQGVRDSYLGGVRGLNEMSDVVNKGPMGDNAMGYHAAQDMYSRLGPSDQEAFQRVMQGRQALEQEILRNSMPTAQGGGIPAEAKLRRMGFGR